MVLDSNKREHLYALDTNGNTVFIYDEKKVENEYFCIGCQKRMIAVHRNKPKKNWYFRHFAKDVKPGEKPCTHSDETFRHKFVKDKLAQTKRLAVPPVYKLPPSGVDGHYNLLEEAKFITGQKVSREIYFFQDDKGLVKWGKGYKGQNLLIKPDLAFFNNEGHPILLIEFKATHTVDADKLAKIKYLGIDTVEIDLPKSSPGDLETTLTTYSRTKWLFNNTYENTEYVHVPIGDSGKTAEIEDDEKRLFEESFSCRAAEINHLIRRIRNCLESEHYRRIEEHLRAEIQGVEGNTETHQDKWSGIQESRRSEIEKQYQGEVDRLEREERKHEENSSNLETRYLNKREQYVTEEEDLDNAIRQCIEKLDQDHETLELRRQQVEQEQEQINQDIELAERRTRDFTETTNRIEKENLQSEQRIRQSIENLAASYEEKAAAKIKSIGEEEEELDRARKRIENQFEELREQTVKSVEKQVPGGSPEFARAFKKLDVDRRLLDDFQEISLIIDRKRSALKAIRSGAYKDWNNLEKS